MIWWPYLALKAVALQDLPRTKCEAAEYYPDCSVFPEMASSVTAGLREFHLT